MQEDRGLKGRTKAGPTRGPAGCWVSRGAAASCCGCDRSSGPCRWDADVTKGIVADGRLQTDPSAARGRGEPARHRGRDGLLAEHGVGGVHRGGRGRYRYSFFNEQYRRWVASTGASMHIQRDPGESIEVDWAGDPMSFADPVTGAPVDAWLFVAALSFSAYAYVGAFTDMTLGSWIEAHVHAFETFEGTARAGARQPSRRGVQVG